MFDRIWRPRVGESRVSFSLGFASPSRFALQRGTRRQKLRKFFNQKHFEIFFTLIISLQRGASVQKCTAARSKSQRCTAARKKIPKLHCSAEQDAKNLENFFNQNTLKYFCLFRPAHDDTLIYFISSRRRGGSFNTAARNNPLSSASALPPIGYGCKITHVAQGRCLTAYGAQGSEKVEFRLA